MQTPLRALVHILTVGWKKHMLRVKKPHWYLAAADTEFHVIWSLLFQSTAVCSVCPLERFVLKNKIKVREQKFPLMSHSMNLHAVQTHNDRWDFDLSSAADSGFMLWCHIQQVIGIYGSLNILTIKYVHTSFRRLVGTDSSSISRSETLLWRTYCCRRTPGL